MTPIKKKIITLPNSLEELQYLKEKSFTQSNPLIEAIFIQPFKELELKVLCLISKHININKYTSENKPLRDVIGESMKITVSKNEFCNELKTNPSNFYSQIRSLSEELTSKKIRIQEHQSKTNFANIVLFPAVICKDSQVTFYVSGLLQPYLQHLKENFTTLSLEHITNMKSSYAIKVFQLLKQYQSLGKRSFYIEELKNILGISHLYVDNFNDFKKDVLLTVQKHINEYTDLKISFRTSKIGRKVESIIFIIEEKQNQFTQAIKTFTQEIDNILKQKISYGGYHQIVQKHWKSTKKNIEKNKILFNIWIKNRVSEYKPISIQSLSLLPIVFSDLYEEVPKWYVDFIQDSFQLFLETISKRH